MDKRRLSTLLLVGALQTACMQFTPYRSEIPPADAPEGFACTVTATLKGLPACEEPGSENAHAVQHRRYATQFKLNEQQREELGSGRADDPVDEEDYYLSFVEFDDQGWFAAREQMKALLSLLTKLEEEEREVLVYVYAHGWKHNASACDDNVVCFSRMLERLDLAEKKVLGSQRAVVGVYLGWRGLPFRSFANNLSFWTRKDTAARVGSGGVFELLTRLNDYRNRRQANGTGERHEKTQLWITGHSFGGLVIYSALSHALMERAARTPTDESGEKDEARSFGDFVMLVNPAFEGSLYEPLFHIATHRIYPDEQRPVMMIVTSDADGATKNFFPAGRSLSTLFQHARSPEQGRALRTAIGHDPRYVTHELKADEPRGEEKKESCGCPHLDPTEEWDQQSLLTLLDAAIGFGSVRLTPVACPNYEPNYPYLVVRTDGNVIADHNAIYNEHFVNFAQTFFTRYVAHGIERSDD